MDLDDLRNLLAHEPQSGWIVPGLEPVSVAPGVVAVRLEVGAGLVNIGGSLHGGAATLVDVVGTFAIITADRHSRFGVSTDLNCSWFAPVALGDVAVVEATVLKCGRSLAFVTADIRRESDGTLCVQGRMTKSLGPPPEVNPDSEA